MTRFSIFVAAVVAISQLPGGNAAITGMHANRDVASAHHKKRAAGFREHKAGWPGFKFPDDPWGIVIGEDTSEAASATTGVVVGSGIGNVGSAPEATSVVVVSSASVNPFPTYAPLPSAAAPIISSANSTLAAATSSTTSKSSTKVTSSLASAATAALIAPPVSHKTSSTKVIPTFTPPAQTPQTTSQEPVTTSKKPVATSQAPAAPSSAPASSSPASSGSDSNEGSGNTSGPTDQADIQAYLSAHNSIRAQHGAAALTYSQSLAAKAQQWANGCVFKHSGGSLGPFGENLAAGTGGGYGIPQAIKSWTDEVSQYDPSNPVPSHFTQVVWKGTTQVGCALQNCNGIFPSSFGEAHYYVCEYSPQGNIIGEFAQNVQA